MTRVLLVDDDALVRSGLRLMLGEADDIAIVGRPPTATRCPPRSPSTVPTSY